MANFVESARTMASQCACMRVRRASRTLTRIYDEVLRPLGLQISQLTVLVAVAHFGDTGASMTALAEALVMDRTTVTRNLRPLEKAGLLRVARSPHDARSRVVVLTRAGEQQIQAALPRWQRAQKHVRGALGARALEQLHSQIDRITRLGPAPAAPGKRAAKKR